jgi:uncharacterized membrane protein YdjX (TVP38/TMEM64 family)
VNRAILPALAVVVIWSLLLAVWLLNPGLRNSILAIAESYPLAAPAILTAAQVVCAVLALPSSFITLAFGVLWGLPAGLFFATASTLISSMTTFWLARRFRWGDSPIALERGSMLRQIETYGWKASAVAHLNPLLPGSTLSYVFGTSKIRVAPFLVGALLGTLPLQLVLIAFGTLVRIGS